MMIKFIHKILIIISMMLLFSVYSFNAGADDIEDWDYYKIITVSDKIEGYQTFLNITKTSGGDANCSGNCNNNFSDLRFTANNGTFIPYWIEDKVDGSYAHVWVNNKWNGTTLYMYYGNSDAETLSNGTETFVYFNDFSSSTSISKTDYGNGAYYYFGSFSLTGGFIVNYDWYIYSLNSHNYGALRSWSLTNDDDVQLVNYFQDSDDTDHGTPPLIRLDDFYGVSTATWYEVTSKYIPDTEHKLYLDDVLIDTHASPDNDTSFTRVRWTTADYTSGVTDLTWDAVNERLDAVGWRRDSGGYLKAYIDNFYIAKFASLEPSYAFGAEIAGSLKYEELNPADTETDVGLSQCSISLNISHSQGLLFNYSWGCSDGSYNSAVGNSNGTKYLMLHHCPLDCGTTYTWWINVSEYNNDSNYINKTYSFITRDCESVYSNIHPANASAGLCPCCENYTCICINASHESGNNVNISFYSNYSAINNTIFKFGSMLTSSGSFITSSDASASFFTCDKTGVITKIYARVKKSIDNVEIKAFVYEYIANNDAGILLGNSSNYVVSSNDFYWQEFILDNPINVDADTNYFLGLMANSTYNYYYVTGAGVIYDQMAWDIPENPFVSEDYRSRIMSIYAEGTWEEPVFEELETFVNVSGTYCVFFPVEYEIQYWWYVNVSEYGNASNYNQTDILTFIIGSELNCSLISEDCPAIETVIMMYIDAYAMYIITLLLFAIFFIIGYLSEKRSAGAFLLISGLLLMIMSIQSFEDLGVLTILVLAGSIFISLIGINKWLITPNMPEKST